MAVRVLVVDDVASMRLLYRAYFKFTDLDVELYEAASGEEAIELLDTQEVDVVLTDHRMGAMTGIDVLVHALEKQPRALRCMMTGYADPELAAEAREIARVDVFMEKAMGVDQIKEALERDIASRMRSAAPGTPRARPD